MERPEHSWVIGSILAGVLACATLVVYAPVRHHDFVTYDDSLYVTENPTVQEGLTMHGVAWAFTSGITGNWHPLTWLSHMLDCQLYGVRPAPQHVTNLALHVANTLLIFWILAWTTAALSRSFVVAALFALHPLHVESVAWIAERKDVLSTFFALLAVMAYVRYTVTSSRKTYLLSVVFFFLGLMAKPMVMTVPFVLLLLDVWPLRRLRLLGAGDERGESAGVRGARALPFSRLLAEKLPFLAGGAAGAIVAIVFQHRNGATAPVDAIPLALRFENAAVSYARYLASMLWPARLSALYPFPRALPAVLVAAAAMFLVLASTAVLLAARRRPYLAMGWFWYLGTLLPVIGLVQVGLQARADRYTYIPLIGVFVLLVWSAADAVPRTRLARVLLGTGTAALLVVFAAASRHQLAYWKDSITLYSHALDVDADNPIMHYNLADSLAEIGSLQQAVNHYVAALHSDPDFVEAHVNFGNTLRRMRRLDEAVASYEQAIRIEPAHAVAHNNLGLALSDLGRIDEAIAHYSEAVRLDANYGNARRNLGRALAATGRTSEALAQFTDLVRMKPRDIDARLLLGDTLAGQGRTADAVSHYALAMRTDPDDSRVHYRLAVALHILGRQVASAAQYCEAVRLDPLADRQDPRLRLRWIVPDRGRLEDVIRDLERLCSEARASSSTNLSASIGPVAPPPDPD